MTMTMREAVALAEKLWSRSGTAFLNGTVAKTLGRSDVDWESAFAQATGDLK
jgi:hypothetical protein